MLHHINKYTQNGGYSILYDIGQVYISLKKCNINWINLKIWRKEEKQPTWIDKEVSQSKKDKTKQEQTNNIVECINRYRKITTVQYDQPKIKME